VPADGDLHEVAAGAVLVDLSRGVGTRHLSTNSNAWHSNEPFRYIGHLPIYSQRS
jgi:hypothetical protein